jgi:hypothetical protein
LSNIETSAKKKTKRGTNPLSSNRESKADSMMKGLIKLSNQNLVDLVAGNKSLETIQLEMMSEKEWLDILLHTDLSDCQYLTFKRLMKNERILNKISQHLLSIHNSSPIYPD